jgi:hypothetical protein
MCSPSGPDTPVGIEATRRFLADLGRLKDTARSHEGLFDKMTELYPSWSAHNPG